MQRQIQIYESGGEVEQETMHFDPGNESAPPLRSKEEAQDYRYLPEPDLVPLEPPRDLVERLRGELPGAAERPWRPLAESRLRARRGSRHERPGRLFERVGGDRRPSRTCS
jgi:Asp-tRNA(Asn)/Glu-tRNA(Gln) amidotransferase B subunit